MIDKESQEQFRSACFKYAKAFDAIAEGLRAAAEAARQAGAAFGEVARSYKAEPQCKQLQDLLGNLIGRERGKSWALQEEGLWANIRASAEAKWRQAPAGFEVTDLAKDVLNMHGMKVPSDDVIRRAWEALS